MPNPEQALDFILGMRWQDWVDILIVAFLIYQALRLIRGTSSMQMLLGLAMVLVAYIFSVKFELLTLTWILNNFLSYLIIILVILFQSDLRRGLTKVAKISFGRSAPELMSVVGEVVKASFAMAEKRIGALIVFERDVGLKTYTDMGTELDAKPSVDLILSIFNTAAPLHDGALMIQDGRATAAACFLPLSTSDDVARFFGTRHRAAIGLTRETDAAVVVVSEERGLVSLVLDGDVKVMFGQNELRDRLAGLLNLKVSGREEKESSEEEDEDLKGDKG